MNDPPRLFDEHQGDLESVLLAAMRADRPPAGVRERVLAGLSRWAPAAALGFWTTSALAHAGPWTKVGLCLVAVGAVPASVAVVRSLDGVPTSTLPTSIEAARPPEAAVPTSHPGLAASPVDPAPAGVTTASAATSLPVGSASSGLGTGPSVAIAAVVAPTPERVAADAAEERLVASSAGAEPASSGAFPLVMPSTLDAEVAALHGVRRALDQGSPGVALQQLDRYGRTFPRGGLAFEAAVLRVQALVLQGDRAGAELLARSLLARSPDGPHARRIRTLLSWQQD
ncbi:MAG: hypothetical protein JW751_30100 [Polyangiaceae bacterium]|nr:hypothetical protein [Polyangiaceae bacterium]